MRRRGVSFVGARAVLGLLALTLALSGCGWLRPADATPLPGGGYWTPLAPALLGRSFNAVQRVTGEFGAHRAVLLCYLEVSGNHLALAATTPDGTELFSLEQDGTRLQVHSSPLLPKQLRPQAVLADLQMTFWPAVAVAPALARNGLTMTEHAGDAGAVRIIARGGTPVATITYGAADPWRGAVVFEQHAWHYRYAVDTLQWEPAKP